MAPPTEEVPPRRGLAASPRTISATSKTSAAAFYGPSVWCSAGEIADQRKRRVAANLAAIDLQVFQHALHINPRLADRDSFDPVDHVDLAAARVAILGEPLVDPA